MSSLGSRLREERHRLRLSQKDFSVLGGVRANAQGKYESDQRFPNARYLTAISTACVDILYVTTGNRTPSIIEPLSGHELDVLLSYRALDRTSQGVLEGLLELYTKLRCKAAVVEA